MNGRKAKALRRLSRRMTQGLPERDLIEVGTGRAAKVDTGKLDSLGRPIYRYVDVTGTKRHRPTTMRAVYQRNKAIYGRVNLRELR
ncbi:hypothetical protein [Bordetella genomosp. 1]|uniref:Uncharacterized protein n=1 Tax=Bordetella genomosp. 1 TaxID=1395607 RepID=A0ABX4EW77_9BORD|nr:hypothetical protein [Bordetella genomosp. 1]OZI58726.1 hypothetical protein CAL27_18770 [Bordetella genomosp. 1]